MTKLSFDFASSFTVEKRNGASVTVDIKRLPAAILADIFAYGLGQKVRDSASGEPEVAGSTAAMTETVDTLYAGEWSLRGTGGSSDPMDTFRLQAVRAYMKAGKTTTAKELKASHDAIDGSDQKARAEHLMAFYAKHEAAFEPAAETLKAQADAKRDLATAIEI